MTPRLVGSVWLRALIVVHAFALVPLANASCAPPDRAIITEVFYDASGDDTGFEFVELFNPTAHSVSFAAVRLEAGDGAGSGRWTLRWTGTVADSLAPGAHFVIGGGAVEPAPQALVTLALQNGPDAVRLKWPDGALEVVGYGVLTDPEYFCVSPAADVPSGFALARVPDDADLGGNALDFRAAPPSPGRANQPRRDLALAQNLLVLEPAHPREFQPLTLRGAVVNRGAESIVAGEAFIEASRGVGAGADSLGSTPLASPLAPGDSAAFVLALPGLPAGKLALSVNARLPGDEDPDNDRDSLLVRVGDGPLTLSEVQFHPAHGEGEWVEVLAWNASSSALDGFSIADATGTTAVLHAGETMLAPGTRAVLAQDRTALLAEHPSLDSTRVYALGSWPSLNNSDNDQGIADVLSLREPDGTLADILAYSAAGVPAAIPLERTLDGRWQPGTDAGGTPLDPPRTWPALAGRFSARPLRIGAGGRTHLDWSLPWAWARVSVQAFDLAGRPLGVVLEESVRSGRGGIEWAAEGRSPGICLLMLRAEPEHGDGLITATLALRIDGAPR